MICHTIQNAIHSKHNKVTEPGNGYSAEISPKDSYDVYEVVAIMRSFQLFGIEHHHYVLLPFQGYLDLLVQPLLEF